MINAWEVSTLGKRGPHPAPTATKLLHGTRADRVNTDEPIPDGPGAGGVESGDSPGAGGLRPPDWLDAESVAIWHQYAPDLTAKGVLTAWDVEAFAALCDVAARRRRAVKVIADEGEVVEAPVFDRNGEPTGTRRVRNHWLVVLNACDKQLVAWAGRFGMTPSDRAQLGGGGKGRDPHEDLLT